MARSHFQTEVRAGRQQGYVADGAKRDQSWLSPLARSSVVLTKELIEAFVAEFLAEKYDYPKGKVIPTPEFHREIWSYCADNEKTHVLILAPRGHAKSTSVTEAYGTAALLFRQRDFAVIISNTVGQSIEFLEDFKAELKFNDELREQFEIKGLIRDREDDIIVQFKDGHKFRVRAAGSGQEIRGMKWNKRRPNLVLCDDLEGKEQLGSTELRKKFSDWFMRDVLPFGADDCLFRYCATIRHFDSLAAQLAKDPEWKTLTYRAHESMGNFTNLLWPEKFSEERLRSIQAKYTIKGDRDGYSQEYLNVPIAEGNNLFRPEDLLPMEKEDRRKDDKVYYAAWDLAISLKQGSDYTVCVVLGVDSKNRYYIVDVRRARWDSPDIINEMFLVQKAWNPVVHWIEEEQIARTIGPFIYQEMEKRSTDKEWAQWAYFNIETVRPVQDKVARSAGWRAKCRAHAVKFDHEASWWEDFLAEMKQFPKGQHDDQIDPQSIFGLKLHTDIQPDSTPKEKDEEEYFEQFGLQRTGANAVTGY